MYPAMEKAIPGIEKNAIVSQNCARLSERLVIGSSLPKNAADSTCAACCYVLGQSLGQHFFV